MFTPQIVYTGELAKADFRGDYQLEALASGRGGATIGCKRTSIAEKQAILSQVTCWRFELISIGTLAGAAS